MGQLLDRIKGVFGKKLPGAREYFADSKNWKAVKSSNIAAVAYFLSVQKGVDSVLGIRFLDGSEYWYYGVTIGVYSSFMSAGSKGRFGHQEIYGKDAKGRYRTEKK